MSQYQRMELERKLPPASSKCLGHLNQLLGAESDIRISQEDYLLLNRAFIHYLMSDTGKQTMMSILGNSSKAELLRALKIELEPASYENKYYATVNGQKLDHKDLTYFEGWIYNDPVRKEQVIFKSEDIDVHEIADLVECEGCHNKAPKDYCVKTVRQYTGGREQLETLCNNCRVHSNDLRVQSDTSGKTCTECTHTSCAYHPEKQRAPVGTSFMSKVDAERGSIRQLSAPVFNEAVDFSQI